MPFSKLSLGPSLHFAKITLHFPNCREAEGVRTQESGIMYLRYCDNSRLLGPKLDLQLVFFDSKKVPFLPQKFPLRNHQVVVNIGLLISSEHN
jgi:hypothetical protein